jgi:hypothetical protein
MDHEYLSVAIANGRAANVLPRWCAQTLRDVADGSRALRAVVHPLSFTCLPVVREGRHGVCLHVWRSRQPQARPTTSPVHAHSWDLVSYVLFGQLRNELFLVTDAAVTHQGAWRVLEIRSHGDTDDIVPTPRLVRCDLADSERVVQSDIYTVSAGTFHSSVATTAEVTVTVALASAVPGKADLSLGHPATQTHRVRRTRLGTEDTKALARMIIDQYGRQP